MTTTIKFFQRFFKKFPTFKDKKTCLTDETALKVKDLKSVPSSTEQTSASPKASQVVDSIPAKTLKEIKQGNKKIPEKENQAGEVEQRTDQIAGEVGSEESEARDKFVPKNPKTQAGEDLFVILENPLLYINDIKDQQAKAKAEAQARQASHAGQAYHGEVVPRSPISTIRGERSIPFYAVAGLAIIVTLPFIHRFLKNVRLKRQKKKQRGRSKFFCKRLCNDSWHGNW